MISTLKYGAHGCLHLELPPEALVADCSAPAGMDDTATIIAAAEATQTPLEFPPLRQATVPGDHVVIALGPAVPQAADVVAAILPELLSGGTAANDVTVLRTAEVTALHPPGHSNSESNDADQDPRHRLSPELREAVQLATHDPAHQNSLSYLAADAQGAPIYLNRLLCDADLVIPVGCVRLDGSASSNGRPGVWNDTLYPTFGDRMTLDHFAPNGVPLTAGQMAHRHRQVDQVAWLLGVQITAASCAGGRRQGLASIGRCPEAVFRQGRALCQSVWQRKVSRRASLVVAGVGGGKSQQTWLNVGRALEAALRIVSDDGAIVLCTELQESLGPALKLLAHSTDLAATQTQLRKQRSADAPLARRLAESLDDVTIYLLSGLPEEAVIPLGFAHVNSVAEIGRLATHHHSCILLPDAQYAWPTVAGEKE